MSTEAIQHAREVRQRLRNPPNAIHSSEIEITIPNAVRETWGTMRSDLERTRAELAGANKELARAGHEIIRLRSILSGQMAIAQCLDTETPQPPAEAALSLRHTKLQRIIFATSKHCDIRVTDLMSRRKDPHITRARQIMYFLADELTSLSFMAIGRRLSRDHSTILHGVIRAKDLLATDEAFADALAAIRTAVLSQGETTNVST